MITTNNTDLAKKLRCLRDHGASISDLQRHMGPKPFYYQIIAKLDITKG